MNNELIDKFSGTRSPFDGCMHISSSYILYRLRIVVFLEQMHEIVKLL